MGYRIMGWTAARAMQAFDRATRQRGQGTVEYIGIVVMVALLGGAVGLVASKWGDDVGNKLKDGILKAIGKLAGVLVGRDAS